MNFGNYAPSIADGSLTNWAVPLRRLETTKGVLAPMPMAPGRVYPVQARQGGPHLAYILVNQSRLLMPHELSASNPAQFPDLPTLRSVAGANPVALFTFSLIGRQTALRLGHKLPDAPQA